MSMVFIRKKSRKKPTLPASLKVVFVHPPKTGGTSVRTVLKENLTVRTIGHKRLLHVEDELVVVSVRNPYSRVHSQYYYYKGYRAWRWCPFDRQLSWEEFSAGYPPRVVNWRVERAFPDGIMQSVTEQLNGFKPDYVIRFEHLEQDLIRFFERWGVTVRIPHKNKFRRKPPFDIGKFTKAGIRRINEYFREDFVNFGYEMVDPDTHNHKGEELCS
jgi:hypothetical protein